MYLISLNYLLRKMILHFVEIQINFFLLQTNLVISRWPSHVLLLLSLVRFRKLILLC